MGDITELVVISPDICHGLFAGFKLVVAFSEVFLWFIVFL